MFLAHGHAVIPTVAIVMSTIALGAVMAMTAFKNIADPAKARTRGRNR